MKQKKKNMKKMRCAGVTLEGKRCKHKIVVPNAVLLEEWVCVQHHVRNDVPMKESNGKLFFITKNNNPCAEQIRKKIYVDGRVRYLIQDLQPRYVTEEEFYEVPENYSFFAFQ